jgi:predicted  nucleic acid-binding Zn-ribbon protein
LAEPQHFISQFQSELKDIKKKLRTSEDETNRLESLNSRYSSALKDIQSKISSTLGSSTAADDTNEASAVNGKTDNNS